MAAVLTPTPDLLASFDVDPAAFTFGARLVELEPHTLEALIDAVDDRLETAPADVALELERGRRALLLELSRVLEA